MISVRFFGDVLYEETQLFVTPSAASAYAFGSEHFDATDPERYDINRAGRLFQKARKLDPHYPNLNHQLARIAFLRGHFDTALAYIDVELSENPSPSPSSYYVRGLIKGYMGKYESAAKDYSIYLQHDPTNWAAANDLAWVLLKADRPQDALTAIDKILPGWPDNPWLLNSKATALFELGNLPEALSAAEAATRSVASVTPQEWSHAYPGNDPLIATQGLEAFQKAVFENMHTISIALERKQSGVR